MIPADREWFKNEGASYEALVKLRAAAGFELPNSYLELLKFSNGGEGPLAVSPFTLCLDSAESAIAYKESNTYTEYFPGFFVFGGDGGGSLLAFDIRNKEGPWPIVSIDSTNICLEESVETVAKDFEAFIQFVGVESENV